MNLEHTQTMRVLFVAQKKSRAINLGSEESRPAFNSPYISRESKSAGFPEKRRTETQKFSLSRMAPGIGPVFPAVNVTKQVLEEQPTVGSLLSPQGRDVVVAAEEEAVALVEVEEGGAAGAHAFVIKCAMYTHKAYYECSTDDSMSTETEFRHLFIDFCIWVMHMKEEITLSVVYLRRPPNLQLLLA